MCAQSLKKDLGTKFGLFVCCPFHNELAKYGIQFDYKLIEKSMDGIGT